MRFTIISLLFISIFSFGCQSNNNTGSGNVLADLDPNLPGNIPKLFAVGKVTTPMQDWGITMSGDGIEIYYTISAIKGPGNSKSAIVGLKWENGRWSDPEVVSFSGRFKDSCPNISPDGQRMIFASRRPTAFGDTLNDGNLWGITRVNGTWDDPYPLDKINTEAGEFFPTMAPGGDIYYCTNYLGRGKPVRIYHAKYVNGKYQKPEPITGEILTDKGEYCPYILPDEKHLIIEIVAGPDGLGGGDMYISKKQEDGSWGKAVHLGKEVNSSEHDCYPILSHDGNYLIYMSCRKPKFFNDDGISTFNELLWDVIIPNNEPFDFYWISAELLEKYI